MMYFKYLDLPPVPEYLYLKKEEDFSNLKNIFRIPGYQYYKQYNISDELQRFLESIFTHKFFASYQVIKNGIDIHKDGARVSCMNYLIDTGGPANLNIYDEDKKLILREQIEPLRWHWINVGMFHNVTDITGTRISISLNGLTD